jgi:tight adherence protein C
MVLDAPADRRCPMSERRNLLAADVATAAGLLTIAAVLVLAHAARRPQSRRPPTTVPRPRPHRRIQAASAVVVISVVGVSIVFVGPAAVIVAGGAIALAMIRRRRTSRARRARAIEMAMPDSIELLVLCVHAGRSPTQAVVELARRAPSSVRHGFAAVERQLHRGRGLADALSELPRELGPGARGLASSIAMADRDGLPLAPVLDRLAAEARSERRRLGQAEAQRLPVRLSFPLVVCTLPSFVLLAIAPAVLGAISTLRGTVP